MGGATASPMTSDPLTPRPPTVVCHCGAAGGASPGSHPALLSLTPALPRGLIPRAGGTGRALPSGRRGSCLGSCPKTLIQSQWHPQGYGPDPSPLVLSQVRLRGSGGRGPSDTPCPISISSAPKPFICPCAFMCQLGNKIPAFFIHICIIWCG